ncbi:histidine kinase [Marinilabiliaceae bacterium JC017]|nr:histidine kinase [Marinilabiliaceae bacterium JC017]
MKKLKKIRPYVVVALFGIGAKEFLFRYSAINTADIAVIDTPVSQLIWALNFILCYRLFLILDRRLEEHIPWFFFPNRRIVLQGGVTLVALAGMLYVLLTINKLIVGIEHPFRIKDQGVLPILVIYLFILFILLYIVSKNSLNSLQKYYKETEKLKEEKSKAEYKALQDQINPHFLFNSLNVLVSEIEYNPGNAQKFTRKLSDVYRYVLQSRNHELVTIEKELGFTESYIYLHQVRLGENLQYQVDVEAKNREAQIPPLTLQLLCENAIKHNIATSKKPLQINVFTQGAYLCVKNSFQLRLEVASLGTGLENLRQRLRLMGAGDLKVEQTEEYFLVRIPMIIS